MGDTCTLFPTEHPDMIPKFPMKLGSVQSIYGKKLDTLGHTHKKSIHWGYVKSSRRNEAFGNSSPPGGWLSDDFGCSSVPAVSHSLPRNMLQCHLGASQSLTIATTYLTSRTSSHSDLSAPDSWLIDETISPAPLCELAPLPISDSIAARVSLLAYDPGFTIGDDCFLH